MVNFVAVDSGTTKTSLWLVQGSTVRHRSQLPLGVRDSAISGNRSQLSQGLRQALAQMANRQAYRPRFILAAGMITSGLGLLEVPHVVAPAGKAELSKHVRMKEFPEICPLPFFFVPGVRIGSSPCHVDDLDQADIIRGEETEIVGLMADRRWRGPFLYLHLGSHTKAISVDKHGCIVRSVTTLGGESLQALRTQTILASQLANVGEVVLDKRFFRSGMECAQRSGLLRALFSIRLLGENRRYTPAQLFSFLLGAVLDSEVRALRSQGLLRQKQLRIALSGQPGLQRAWKLVLEQQKHRVTFLRPAQTEKAFLRGLREVVFSSQVFRSFSSLNPMQK